MKKLISFCVVLTLCCTLFGCEGSKKETAEKADVQQSASQWETLTTVKHQKKIYSTGFYSKTLGVAVGYDGLIEYTNDGGKTWMDAQNTSLCRFGMEMVSDQVGYTCGNGGNVTKTLDGAKTWKRMDDFGDSEPDECTILSFVSEDVGMIASAKKLAVTKDGATSWNALTPPADIVTIQMVNEKNCYLVGKDKMLYSSTDGGQNWEKQALTLPDLAEYKSNVKSMALHINEDGRGELFCIDINGLVKAYSTENEGKAWVQEKIPEAAGVSFLYISEDGSILTANDSTGREVTVLFRK